MKLLDSNSVDGGFDNDDLDTGNLVGGDLARGGGLDGGDLDDDGSEGGGLHRAGSKAGEPSPDY